MVEWDLEDSEESETSLDGTVDIQAAVETKPADWKWLDCMKQVLADSDFEAVEREHAAVVEVDHNCHLKVKC